VIGGPVVFGIQQSRAASDVKRERDFANDERDRAERNFAQALAAVDVLLARVGEERLDGVPQMELVRRELIEDALRFYGELAAQKPDDPRLRIEAARLEATLANTEHQLGFHAEASTRFDASLAELRVATASAADDALRREYLAEALIRSATARMSGSRFDDARRELGEARVLLEALVREHAEAHDARRKLIVALHNAALLARDGGELSEAADLERDAIERATALRAELPHDLDVRSLHATSIANAGVVARMRGDLGLASELLRGALPPLEELARGAPDDRRSQSHLVDACGNLGLVLTQRGEAVEAEVVLRKGLATAQRLVANYPNSPGYRRSLGDIGINLGMLLADLARFEEACAVLEPAITQLERLADDHPLEADYRANLGVALTNLGCLQQDFGSLEAGRAHLLRAAECERTALELRPANSVYQRHLAIVHLNLGEGWLKQNAHSEAATELARVLPLCSSDAQVARYLASLWMRCATTAGADASTNADARTQVVDESCSNGLAALRAAVSAGYSDLAELRTSPDFEPLRSLPAFVELTGGGNSTAD
jgi:eukaryotic-like serine/threonine-protein kinase